MYILCKKISVIILKCVKVLIIQLMWSGDRIDIKLTSKTYIIDDVYSPEERSLTLTLPTFVPQIPQSQRHT